MGRRRLRLAKLPPTNYIRGMADEPESLTLGLLQEMRGDMQAIRSDIHELRSEVKDLTQRVDGNTLILNLVAGVVHDHEQRLEQPKV